MNGVLCGYYDMGNGFAPIVCLEQTGDLVIMDDLCGASYISELTVEEPVLVTKGPSIMEREDCRGMVITKDGVYRFYEDEYKFYSIEEIGKVKFSHKYDTEQSYEGDEIDY